jgi:hypothetical protein
MDSRIFSASVALLLLNGVMADSIASLPRACVVMELQAVGVVQSCDL